MGRRRINRTSEEEEIFRKKHRERNALAQKRRYERIKANRILNSINVINQLNSSNVEEIDFSKINPTQHYLGPLNVQCIYCGALHFESEKVSHKGCSFNDCCSHGAVKLEPMPEFSEFLKSLFNGLHEKSNNFFQKIRVYNNSLAFASFQTGEIFKDSKKTRPGPYCFKVQGQIYNRINTALYPAVNENPTYGQLFITDPKEAFNQRVNQNEKVKLDPELLKTLDAFIRENNIFAQSY